MEENPCVSQVVDLMMICAEKIRVCVSVCVFVMRSVIVCLPATPSKSLLCQQVPAIAKLKIFSREIRHRQGFEYERDPFIVSIMKTGPSLSKVKSDKAQSSDFVSPDKTA